MLKLVSDKKKSNVVDFQPAYVKKVAKKFVDIYESTGKKDANRYGSQVLNNWEDIREDLKIAISEEFKRRGFTV